MDGDRLKELREKFGYSREELAEKVCVTKYIIQSWEEGWAFMNPSSGEIEELADAFHMTEEELRDVLAQDEDDDYSDDQKLSFIDYVDAGVRMLEHIKKQI